MQSSTIEELSSGRRTAEELKAIIAEATGLDPAAKELADKIICSFSAAIYDLGNAGALKHESVTIVARSPGGGSVDQGCEYSAMKKRKISPAKKDQRGGYRTRSTGSNCRRVSANTLNDGFTWRKYGQKNIFSSKFPRSYFRCTHKYDRGCQATRQVQKSEEEPELYVITYIGEHVCQDQAKTPFNASSNLRRSCVISFKSSSVDDVEAVGPSVCAPSAVANAKQETDEDMVSNQSTPMYSRSPEFFTSPVIDPLAGLLDGRDVCYLPMPFMEDLYVNWDDLM